MNDINTAPKSATQDAAPQPRYFRERIGDQEFMLVEERLRVFDDVTLWTDNPRLQPMVAGAGAQSEKQLEELLRRTPGYDPLKKSIHDIGQMEAIYVWKREDQHKYLVIEGATRVAIVRELFRKYEGKPEADRHATVKVKILPPDFTEQQRAILLARIHVRGTGVRAWGRYIEAKFIHDQVAERPNRPPVMTMQDLAKYMGKSVSWISRLHAAYEFAQKFVEHVDSPDAEQIAVREFSTLEEISKATGVGPKLRDYTNTDHDALRGEVFEMVRNEVFSEYRDARFLKDFHDDPEAWALLKQGEKGIAKKLSADIKTKGKGLTAKIAGLEDQIRRAVERDDEAPLHDEQVEQLRRALDQAERVVHPDLNPFVLRMNGFTKALEEASLTDVRSVTHDVHDRFRAALDDFNARLAKNKSWE